jgi:hypothetical protein
LFLFLLLFAFSFFFFFFFLLAPSLPTYKHGTPTQNPTVPSPNQTHKPKKEKAAHFDASNNKQSHNAKPL